MNSLKSFIFLCIVAVANLQSTKISRNSGNLLTNLTQVQEFKDHIVTSSLDNSLMIRMFYRGFRELYSNLMSGTGNRHNSERYQTAISNRVPFPCVDVKNFRSKKKPKSVHQLRPGDFDIVAAMGDSLTSATAANSAALHELLVENRGLSWSIGGQGSWRSHLTLPNILKVFNPNLYGFSLSDAYNVHKSAQFNIAENIATTTDMPFNAKILMQRMMKDPRVDMKKHWKLLTLMIGGNDFCSDVCHQKNATQWLNEVQRKYLVQTLRYLRDASPRTLVNLVPSPLVNLLFSVDRVAIPLSCYLSMPIECSCLFGKKYSRNREQYRVLERKFTQIMEEVSFMSELHTNDFTVVYQPFFKDASIFYQNNDKPDLTIMAIDCLHLSQKGHALSANGIWNNMLEPVGRKSLGLQPLFKKFNCPTERHPYIFTNYNSNNFF
ncbi:hypothetical protein PVAND_003750 [Polypedilum vanderplanki]|uniref:Phospholipase B1, membrane-associated n=1 Tax=Polypedilum vanderplanki TaxID=319348 RepID=A0A9J6BVI5_POLVA|nr:hypothetical protein PVAND_003750 [Polypedilum vanderplanki]